MMIARRLQCSVAWRSSSLAASLHRRRRGIPAPPQPSPPPPPSSSMALLSPSHHRPCGSGRSMVLGAARVFSSPAATSLPRPSAQPISEIVLYQYAACPFCNKVRAFLDYYDLPYKLVEVNPINKKEIKWSDHKKVPILLIDGKQLTESTEIISTIYQRLNPSDEEDLSGVGRAEEDKWRRWVDEHLVHMLAPNIYRKPSEALESFNYITTLGNFTAFERWTAKYVGAAAMYFISKKLKKRHNIADERSSLYNAADTWVKGLNNRPFMGGSQPDLADLAVFGVLRPIWHLQAGRDLAANSRIGPWYDRMQVAVGESSKIEE